MPKTEVKTTKRELPPAILKLPQKGRSCMKIFYKCCQDSSPLERRNGIYKPPRGNLCPLQLLAFSVRLLASHSHLWPFPLTQGKRGPSLSLKIHFDLFHLLRGKVFPSTTSSFHIVYLPFLYGSSAPASYISKFIPISINMSLEPEAPARNYLSLKKNFFYHYQTSCKGGYLNVKLMCYETKKEQKQLIGGVTLC